MRTHDANPIGSGGPLPDEYGLPPALAVHALSEQHVVVELHERLTAPGPALELHVVQDSETGETIAWWEDERGRWLAAAAVGRS